MNRPTVHYEVIIDDDNPDIEGIESLARGLYWGTQHCEPQEARDAWQSVLDITHQFLYYDRPLTEWHQVVQPLKDGMNYAWSLTTGEREQPS